MRVRLACAAAVLTIAGCASHHSADSPETFKAYLGQVERVRLPVNRLLDEADPILSGYRDHRIATKEAQSRMDALERRFARYTVQITAVHPVPTSMRAGQAAYAHTFVLEDAYLSALVNALPDRRFDDLPNTQNDQR